MSAREWMTAIATAAAVIVALVSPWIVEAVRRRRQAQRAPQLQLTFNPSLDAMLELAHYTDGVSHPQAWIRFGVHNAPGRRAAQHVTVLLEGLSVLESPFTDPDRPDRNPRSAVNRVIHIASPAMRWTHLESSSLTIAPDATRYLDVATLALRRDIVEPRIQLLIVGEPADRRHHLGPGVYQLSLLVTGENVEASRWSVDISWDGERGDVDEDVWDHLKIDQPRGPF